MAIPYSYSFRNLWTRRLTTVLTASGMALVVFVFAATLMLATGLRKTLVETGSHDNVVVIRKASQSEVQSGVDRDQAAIVESQPEVAVGSGRQAAPGQGDGRPHQPAQAGHRQAVERGDPGRQPRRRSRSGRR